MTAKVNSFIISGTQVMDGNGLMLVLAVGVNKVSGMNDVLMQGESTE